MDRTVQDAQYKSALKSAGLVEKLSQSQSLDKKAMQSEHAEQLEEISVPTQATDSRQQLQHGIQLEQKLQKAMGP